VNFRYFFLPLPPFLRPRSFESRFDLSGFSLFASLRGFGAVVAALRLRSEDGGLAAGVSSRRLLVAELVGWFEPPPDEISFFPLPLLSLLEGLLAGRLGLGLEEVEGFDVLEEDEGFEEPEETSGFDLVGAAADEAGLADCPDVVEPVSPCGGWVKSFSRKKRSPCNSPVVALARPDWLSPRGGLPLALSRSPCPWPPSSPFP